VVEHNAGNASAKIAVVSWKASAVVAVVLVRLLALPVSVYAQATVETGITTSGASNVTTLAPDFQKLGDTITSTGAEATHQPADSAAMPPPGAADSADQSAPDEGTDDPGVPATDDSAD
jgi:hypothetical protein